MADAEGEAGYKEHLRETVEGATAVLKRAFGGRPELHVEHSFRDPEYRATVLRCGVRTPDGAAGLPETVIVKRFRGDRGEPYDSDDTNLMGARARFLNEWTGVRFLQRIGGSQPFGPALYGVDGRLGLVVLEDMGDGECLADHLQGDDPEAAEQALRAYAATLGRLHAATVGRQQDYAALRAESVRGGSNSAGARMVHTWVTSGVPRFREACAALDLAISHVAETELRELEAVVADSGPFMAFSVGDTCPDNHRYVPNDPGYLRFYDMEFGGFQHALLDAAYLWMPFPTCWCAARLPSELPERLEDAYRAELIHGCPVAANDETFQSAMAHACAVWFVLTVAWSLVRVLKRDDQWGISTVRQRFPLRARNFARVAERSNDLPALATLARQFADGVRSRWGEEADMPLYRPFRVGGR